MVLKGEETSNCGWTGKLVPSKRQKKFFQECFNAARNAYNWARWQNLQEYEKWQEVKQEYLATLKEKDTDEKEIDKLFKNFCREKKKEYVRLPRTLCTDFTKERKSNPEKYDWMKEVDCMAFFNAIALDYKSAVDNFNRDYAKNEARIAKKIAKKVRTKNGELKKFKYPKDYGFPQYCKKGTSYHVGETPKKNIDYEKGKIKLPKVGWVKVSHDRDIPVFEFPSLNLGNPVVSFDGFDYYLSFGYYKPNVSLNKPQTDYIGVSTGLAVLATLSDGTEIQNPAKDPKIVKLEKRKRYLQRYMDKLMNGKSANFVGIAHNQKWTKTSRKVRLLQDRILRLTRDINEYKVQQMKLVASQIVQDNPKGIIFRDDNIVDMFQDKHFAPHLQATGMAKFKDILTNAAERCNIEVRQTDKYVKTTVTCNSCGYEHDIMKDVRRRTFNCPKCGHVMGRAHNASHNIEELWSLSKPIKKETA